MYFTSLPDHSAPAFDEAMHFSNFNKNNIIFNAEVHNSECDDHIGCLSLKRVLKGEEWYTVNHTPIAVRPGQFLILNDQQRYSSRIDSLETVQSQSVFFKRSFAASVFYDASTKIGKSLDNPFEISDSPEFFQTLCPTNPDLEYLLYHLIHDLEKWGYHKSRIDEHLVILLRHLITEHGKQIRKSNEIKAIKLTTRKEVYKRLCIAKDFMQSCFKENLDLDTLSSACCLSVPQLVRQFKAVYHTSPYQYLTQLRLEYATVLLKSTSISIQELTWMCGFEDPSSFCRLFRKHKGVSPIQYRFLTN